MNLTNLDFNLDACNSICNCHTFFGACRKTLAIFNLNICEIPGKPNHYDLRKVNLTPDDQNDCDTSQLMNLTKDEMRKKLQENFIQTDDLGCHDCPPRQTAVGNFGSGIV